MNQTLKMSRVDSVDALRGFAVVAIMLLHFIEHFIYGVYPEATSETAKLLDQSVWDGLFFIFGGKSYTIFALLFGFTFIVQQRNQESKGRILADVLHGDWCYLCFSQRSTPCSSPAVMC